MTPSAILELSITIKHQASLLGFDLVGITPAVSASGFHRLIDWIDAGYAGEMHYFRNRLPAYEHPRHVLDGVRSLIVLGMHYMTEHPKPVMAGEGRISCYAWSPVDYHDHVHNCLRRLADFLRSQVPGCVARGVVDTAPILEREFAQRAGLGWTGKHTLVLNRTSGSYFFLAALLVDLELDYDEPFENEYCGTCTACLDACPTQAFPQPYVLDATRCISYLTIEHRTSIPDDVRASMGDWLFGCDVCQQVCPWNHKSQKSGSAEFVPRADQNPLALGPLFDLDPSAFRTRFRGTPLWRAKRSGLLRNAAIVMGNRPCVNNIAPLSQGLCDSEPMVREASAWALGRHMEWPGAGAVLQARRAAEHERHVRDAIDRALAAV